MRKLAYIEICFLLVLSMGHVNLIAQVTMPINGIADPQIGSYYFYNAVIVKDANTTLSNSSMLIKDGKIVSIGGHPAKDAVAIDCKGRYIYPSFIDIFSDYGMPVVARSGSGFNFFGSQQFISNKQGPYNWNQAIKSEVNAFELFKADEAKAKQLRELGFGAVLTHQKDGIARGTGSFISLNDTRENLLILKDKAANFLSFNKGSSSQSYPSSTMGAIALLRQTYLDADWYAKYTPEKEGLNKSLEAWNTNASLPQFFEAGDKWADIRANKIAKEFSRNYIIKGGNNEYQRIQEIAALQSSFILPLNFPETQNVEDPEDARFVAWKDLAHWELAPGNLAAFEKANINFAITSADLNDLKKFWNNLRKAIQYGLSEKKALEALTAIPAKLIKVYDKVGSLEVGKVANFLITTGNIFDSKTQIVENWIQGNKFMMEAASVKKLTNPFSITFEEEGQKKQLQLISKNEQVFIVDKDTIPAKLKWNENQVQLSYVVGGKNKQSVKDTTKMDAASNSVRLSGFDLGDVWQGTGINKDGQNIVWKAIKLSDSVIDKPTKRAETITVQSKVVYPFLGYGNETIPKSETILIRNATVWTNEKEGILTNTDVLIKGGKIAQIAQNIVSAEAKIIDGTGKYLTAGIIDEHSHIAAFSINEGSQSVTSEVRIGDNLNPDDINIYRQLSGGVTTSQILHGSANTIGGQSQLIKLRWGADDEGLKFKGADPFIKFALGENVKRTAAVTGNTRFPDTRMGVYEVLADAFQRAKDYQAAIKSGRKDVRRDLKLDALVEILNDKRFITCHSYIQSEILGLINIAEQYGFKVNTFTHILEGYKVADRIKQHGASVSTFSDWWAYKYEVKDAVPYNAAIMQKVGLNVCINSDDAEMARRLNQEAAKAVKYGGVSEEEAFKMVTLNPAKALHIADMVGSIKVGKDADVVLWSHPPLSIYAKALYTIIDGIIFFDREADAKKNAFIVADKNRLIQKMIADGKSGSPTIPVRPTRQVILHCEDYEHAHGLLEVNVHED